MLFPVGSDSGIIPDGERPKRRGSTVSGAFLNRRYPVARIRAADKRD